MLAMKKKMSNLKVTSKKAQEEMVGFAVIIIIVSVILLIFLAVFLRSPQKNSVESYEVESFLQAMLQYTTECENVQGFSSVQKLIFECYSNEDCLNGEKSCKVLNKTLNKMLDNAWGKKQGLIHGYFLKLDIDERNFLKIEKGEMQGIGQGAVQYFNKGGDEFEISLQIYGNI